MNFLQLQPLTDALLPAAMDLDQRCFGGLWTLDGYRRELNSPNSEILTLQPPTPNSLPPLLALGCYWAILEEAHITLLGVDPDFHRQGLGQAMLWALLRSARQRGLERATLEVRISNQFALNLYEKFGFRAAGRRKRYYQDTGEDALVLWCGGLQSPTYLNSLNERWEAVNSRLNHCDWSIFRGDESWGCRQPHLTR